MRKTFKMLLAAVAMLGMATACQESLEDRAEREAREYTLKYCPTQPENDVITDSLVFDKKTKTQYYYLTFVGNLDNAEMMSLYKDKLYEGLLEQTRANPQLKPYQEAGFNLSYICRSKSTGKTLLNLTFTKDDYAMR